MKLLRFQILTSLSFSSLIYAPHLLLQSLKPFSSTSINQRRWNSKTNVIITHPVLLIMESCTNMLQLKQIQAHMTRTGLITHAFPVSRVLLFCALSDLGDMRHAHVLFTQIEQPNTFIWNIMIRGYCKACDFETGFSFFRLMVQECVQVDNRSFVFALKACEKSNGVFLGCSVHSIIWKLGFDPDLLVQNGLIHFYAEMGRLILARQVFNEIPNKDVVSWTTMIDGYAAHKCADEAVKLFNLMLSSGVVPNEVTIIAVLSACSLTGDLHLGKYIHDFVQKKNVTYSLNLQNAMLDMYVKCGCLTSAREVFNNMETRDVFSWTSMVNGYAKCGELDLARKLFNEMPKRNVVSWNAIIAGYSQNNQPLEALRLFHEMIEDGFAPIENTLVCVLSACGQLSFLEMGMWIYRCFIGQKCIKLTVMLGNAFIDMYAKCGCIMEAAEIFKKLPGRDLVSWNSMIVGYALHGYATEALMFFEQIKSEGYKPDDITFVAVLSACSHAGLLNEGQNYFKQMKSEFGIEPKGEHYSCMIDLFGRKGLLGEAYMLLKEMPMEPREAAWGALLNACRMHGNVELAKLAACKLLNLDPEDSGIYTLLANICAKERRWGDVTMVRNTMRENGVKKNPGRSLIEVEGKFHEFLAGDNTCHQSGEIYRILNEITLLSRLETSDSKLLNSNVCCEDFMGNITLN